MYTALKGALIVNRLSERIDDAPFQERSDPQPELLPGRPDKVASRNAAHFRIWHKQHAVTLKSNNFGCDLPAGLAAVNTTNIAYRSLYA